KSELRHWKDFYEAPADKKGPAEQQDNIDDLKALAGSIGKAASQAQTGDAGVSPTQPGSPAVTSGGQGTGSTRGPAGESWMGAAPNRLMPIENAPLQQLLATYVVTPTNRSFILIHQQAAHERILYERYKEASIGKQIPSQKSLFPVALTLSAADA